MCSLRSHPQSVTVLLSHFKSLFFFLLMYNRIIITATTAKTGISKESEDNPTTSDTSEPDDTLAISDSEIKDMQYHCQGKFVVDGCVYFYGDFCQLEVTRSS